MVHRALPSLGAGVLAQADVWEDCRADGNGEYRRETITVETAGATFAAQAWVYNWVLPKGAVAVPAGDFARHLALHGLPAFR